MTAIFSVIASAMSILCFWLYYRSDIGPQSQGYKRSHNEKDREMRQSSDSNSNSADEKSPQKKRVSKKMPRIMAKLKKKSKDKYGSLAQSDEDEDDKEHAFNLDDGNDSDREERRLEFRRRQQRTLCKD